MNRNLALVGAAALAIAAAILLQKGLSGPIDERRRAEAPVLVVSAERDVLPGTPLTEADIVPLEIPRRALAPTTITAEHGRDLIGQRLVRARRAGEQLSWFDLQERGRGLASAIPPGERAVTISVDERSGLAGMLKPNDRVDVLLIGAHPPARENAPEKPFARVLLPNVTVLASGSRTGLDVPGDGEAAYATVTLACTPEESAALALAQAKGELVLVLRNPEDNAGMEAGTVIDLDDVLTGRVGVALSKQRQERIEILRRGTRP